MTRRIDKNHISEKPEGSRHRHDAAGTREAKRTRQILHKLAGKNVNESRMDEWTKGIYKRVKGE